MEPSLRGVEPKEIVHTGTILLNRLQDSAPMVDVAQVAQVAKWSGQLLEAQHRAVWTPRGEEKTAEMREYETAWIPDVDRAIALLFGVGERERERDRLRLGWSVIFCWF